MNLYHVTKENYQIGDTVVSNAFNGEFCYYHTKSPYRNVNEFLDETKPDNEPSRTKCIYAFVSLAHCAAFIGRNNDDRFNFYEVELNSKNPHPMCLTDGIKEASSTQLCQIMREEYWHPTREWKFNEYLGTEMIIIEKIEQIPCGFFLIQDDYMNDIRQMERVFLKRQF